MSESFYEKSEQFGHDYLNLHERVRSKEELDIQNIEEIIKKLEERLQKLPENSVLWARIKKQIDELKKQSEEAAGLEKELENTKHQLLELTAASFEIDPQGEKRLSESYIRALTDILLGKEKRLLEFHECVIEPDKIEIVEDEIRALIISANICEFIQEAAKKRLGQTTILNDMWNHISGTENMFKVYKILAIHDKVMTAHEVASLIGEEGWDETKARNNLNNLLRDHLFDHKLIRRVETGKYQISDVGRFLWLDFASLTEQESISKPPSNSSVARPQTMLNTWARS